MLRLLKTKVVLVFSSLFALNRALMFKWVWRFITQGSSLWARVIKALHGYDGKIGQKVKSCYPSLWLDIIHEVEMFKSRGIIWGGVEIQQFEHMKEKVDGCILADMMDRWFWALEGSGEFTIMSVRKLIDDVMLPEVSSKTRWIKAVLLRWWDIDYMKISSYEKWSFRNETIFGSQIPSEAMIFDDVVSRLFYWCRYRCRVSFSWIEWLKTPHLISL
uniref:RNA-directed DNA polymerase, eukaryota, reverse transcriptase zinc-binding domain protein n=1 Tax=Tanacetum cinerariifolium TaxID=118510 RepID=A0A699IF51_TANCI|nr:RNA-directed DNA polymerase, eukaryota, reverse transcriptase zinc-binding domain protein [Tanacetum cinerariifolium]